MTVRQGSVVVSTTSPGYKLYMSMLSDNTNLSSTAVSGVIAATSGTFSSPAALTRGTWGYAIPSGTSHIASNGFNATYNEMSSSTPNNSATFAIPPIASSNPQLIASSTSATTGDTYPIYYGIRANSSTNPGVYSNNIAFTAVADARSVDKVTISPSSSNVNTAITMTINTTLYTTEDYAEANIYLLSTAEYNSISGTNVEALGKTPLKCTKTVTAPLGYSCALSAPSSKGTYYIYVKSPHYNKVYATTFIVNNPVTLTVNPNGGTWNNSTTTQTFTQNEGTTKTIANPSTGPSYTITYNANGQGATYTASPTSVRRSFTSWNKSGGGSLSGTTYTFGSTNGTLKANYNTTSNSFTLPDIKKDGQNCYWAEGSASGTQYAGGTSRTITGNVTYYAVCAKPAFFTITQMQQMTSAVCNSVITPSATATTADTTGAYTSLSNKNTAYVAQRTLTDIRDGNTYTVRKLADGNCWMTENLRLISSSDIVIKPVDSDVTSNFTLKASKSGGWCTEISAACYNQSLAVNSGNSSYGAYYNWYAATAGTGKYSTSSGNATGSICPKGWSLPVGGVEGEFGTLYLKYNSISSLLGTPNFKLSGYYAGYSTYEQNVSTTFWTKTAIKPDGYNYAVVYYLALNNNTGYLYPYSVNLNYYGFSIRCVAQ